MVRVVALCTLGANPTTLAPVASLPQGMGGQFDYFGLYISPEFDKGHSMARPLCSTYQSPRLSKEEEFEIDAVEVNQWGMQCL